MHNIVVMNIVQFNDKNLSSTIYRQEMSSILRYISNNISDCTYHFSSFKQQLVLYLDDHKTYIFTK